MSGDPVGAAIAAAIQQAIELGQWALVSRLAVELEARGQPAGAADEHPLAGVVDLAAERKRRS